MSNIYIHIAQDERTMALRSFLAAEKDVLVATDVAAKGLDFPDIKHVINFDMPKDVCLYIYTNINININRLNHMSIG
jgi:superfamily II DNA/RNA helicase